MTIQFSIEGDISDESLRPERQRKGYYSIINKTYEAIVHILTILLVFHLLY